MVSNAKAVIDFTAALDVEGTQMLILDRTKPNINNQESIYDMRLNVSTDFMDDVVYEVDLITYIYSNRKDLEWYVLTSDMLGRAESLKIPDGIYTVSIRVNNTYTTTHNFIVYQEIKEAAQKVLNDAGYSVYVSNYSFEYQNSTKYDFEKMTLISTLLTAIERNSLDGNIEAASKAMYQLKRILNLKK